MAKPKGGLGKGLGAMFKKETFQDIQKPKEPKASTVKISIKDIDPNPYQPRLHFDKKALTTLMESIKQYGLVQPIVVRKVGDRYELVAGERRWRACKLLNLKEIEAIIKDYSTEETSEIALVENLQRQNLDPIEEAHAYERLKNTFKLTQEEIAKKIGRSRPHIANIMRLLKLPEIVQNKLSSGELTIGQARPLLMLKDKAQQESLIVKIEVEGLSARQIESLVKKINEVDSKDKPEKSTKKKNENKSSAEIRAWEDRLKLTLGTPVDIKFKAGKKVCGSIDVKFSSEEELARLLAFLADEEVKAQAAASEEPKKTVKKKFVL